MHHRHKLLDLINFRIEVLTAVVMKNSVFWDITLCSLLKVKGRFGEIYRLHLQEPRVNRARYQRTAPLATRFHAILLGLFFNPVNGGNIFL
jgi:hypothetical protein